MKKCWWCGSKHYAKGLCRYHYHQSRTRQKQEGLMCKECGEPASKNGLCVMHDMLNHYSDKAQIGIMKR